MTTKRHAIVDDDDDDDGDDGDDGDDDDDDDETKIIKSRSFAMLPLTRLLQCTKF